MPTQTAETWSMRIGRVKASSAEDAISQRDWKSMMSYGKPAIECHATTTDGIWWSLVVVFGEKEPDQLAWLRML